MPAISRALIRTSAAYLAAAALLLNVGVVLVAVAAAGLSPIGADGLRLAGRSLEAAGIAAFAWPLLRRPFR